MSEDQHKARSDEVAREVATWPRSKQLEVYQHLHNGYNCRISNIEWEVDKAWKDEHK